MDAERARAFLLGLPYVVETEQWGGLVYWVGDKTVGGKMFASLWLEGELPARYSAGPERYAELLEREGLRPAPYAARIFWVAAERWSVFRNAEWQAEWTAAHALTLAKLTPRTRSALALARPKRRLLA